jgi:hypothetical protein
VETLLVVVVGVAVMALVVVRPWLISRVGRVAKRRRRDRRR